MQRHADCSRAIGSDSQGSFISTPTQRNTLMNVIFETPRFRVQISGKAAWLESVESGEWVLRGQFPIPISAEALSADAHPSLLRDTVLDFEQVRPGDTRLRAALTGH